MSVQAESRQGLAGAQDLAIRIKRLALALGFDLAGIAPAHATPETQFLREWLARGYAGEMHYLERRLEERIDPTRVLDGVQSILAVALVYDPGDRPPTPRAHGGVARYAGGDDYHDVLLERLQAVEAGIEVLADKPVRTRAYVDTGPVQERVFAWLAGIGWIGKNTCVIHPRLGSYVFLGVLLMDLALIPDAPATDHCGSCTACLDACPTGALVAPHVLDARRCLSYTTIELRGAIPESMREAHGDLLFGCDICQEVCPWNTRRERQVPRDREGLRARLEPRMQWQAPMLDWVLSLDASGWAQASRGTALRRAKHRGLLRNALVAAGNSGERALIPVVRRHAQGSDALLAEHARWALRRLAV